MTLNNTVNRAHFIFFPQNALIRGMTVTGLTTRIVLGKTMCGHEITVRGDVECAAVGPLLYR